MWKIPIQDKVAIRFPGRNASFCKGVEIGMLAVYMSQGSTEFSRVIATGNLEQAKSLGEKLGYHLVENETEREGFIRVTFRNRHEKARLRLVHSAG